MINYLVVQATLGITDGGDGDDRIGGNDGGNDNLIAAQATINCFVGEATTG